MRRRITKFSDSKVIVLKSINEANLQDCTVVSIGLMAEGLHFPQMPCTPYQIKMMTRWVLMDSLHGFPLCSLRWFWGCFICPWDPLLFLVKISRRPSLRRRRELCLRSWFGLLIFYLYIYQIPGYLYQKSFSCMKARYICWWSGTIELLVSEPPYSRIVIYWKYAKSKWR